MEIKVKTKATPTLEQKEREQLLADITTMKDYLLLKVREHDWHGVADAAMDLRELAQKKELIYGY